MSQNKAQLVAASMDSSVLITVRLRLVRGGSIS